MNRMTLLSTTLVGLALAGAAYADGTRPALSSAGAQAVRQSPPTTCGSLPVLYNQGGTTSGVAIVSQNFENMLNQYDSMGADDFHVPASGWTIHEVDVTGQYFSASGPATSETVKFFQNVAPGKPGPLLATYTVTGADTGGSFCIAIPPTVLSQGHYWVSVRANMHFSVGGEWGWENLTPPQIFQPARWKNPGDGFATGCTTWSIENVCAAFGQGDKIFTLR